MTFDPASLGFSASTAALFRRLRADCLASASNRASPTAAGTVATLGAQQSGFNSGRTQPFYNVQIAPTLTKTAGAHTFKIGYDWRQLRQVETNLGGKLEHTGSMAPIRARRAPPRASMARASPRSCLAFPRRTRSSKRAATTTRASTATARSCTTTGACPIASR